MSDSTMAMLLMAFGFALFYLAGMGSMISLLRDILKELRKR